MKRSLMTMTMSSMEPVSSFVPIQSFDLTQDHLLDLFVDSPRRQPTTPALKQEAITTTVTTTSSSHPHHHHHHPHTPAHAHQLHTQPVLVHPTHQRREEEVANSMVFLNAALPAPLELAPLVKRRKRRAVGPPKHVEDLAKLQDLSSSENSDSERGKGSGSVKLQIRKLKNRASAAKSRIKAQARQEQLEKNLVELHQQNVYLRDLVVAMAKASGQPLPVIPALADHEPFDVAL